MKKSVLSVIAISTLLASSLVVLAGNVQGKIKADIPFDFTVGKARLSAGQYTIQRGTSHSQLKLSGDKSSVMVLTCGGSTSSIPSHATEIYTRITRWPGVGRRQHDCRQPDGHQSRARSRAHDKPPRS